MSKGVVAFVDRVGAALVAPGRAFAEAEAGRGGAGDVAWLLLAKVVCGEARAVVAAVWTMVAMDPMAGLSALARQVQAAAGLDLLVWAGAGLVVTAAAGRRRSPARDFDLAGVAWVPFLAVGVVASLAMTLAGWTPPRAVTDGLGLGALAWTLGRVARAAGFARGRAAPGRAAPPHAGAAP